ncbi:MAG: hypothetical protein OXF11_17025 [Deltaproteobacteria bacterium]|nr:hypothetical protein [Deltaproteobacteria bacterium]
MILNQGALSSRGMLMTFITEKSPPKGRAGKCEGELEQHLHEPAVMLAMARWLFNSGAKKVCLRPDGMHAKQFNMRRWLESEGFEKTDAKEKTGDAGTYTRQDQTVDVRFVSGQGDVLAELGGQRVVVEAKGGIINTRHSGQKSRLRKHLYEAVGMLLDGPDPADRLIAAVPLHPDTIKVANKMSGRCRDVGIEIVLVSGAGEVQTV